jgi:hypothetical protein
VSEAEVIGLRESAIIARIANEAGVSVAAAMRLLRGIARAPQGEADAVVGWLVREQIRVAQEANRRLGT